MSKNAVIFLLAGWFIAALLTAGCLRPDQPMAEIITEPPLPAADLRDLRQLASVDDLLEDNSAALNRELLRLAIRADQRTMTAYLRSRGYFDPEINVGIQETNRLHPVRYTIQTGPAYQLETARIIWPADVDPALTQRPAAGRSGTASASAIIAERTALLRHLREQGYPGVRVSAQEIVVDHATRSVRPTFTIETGPFTRFGDLQINGLNKLRPSYVNKAQPWAINDPYDVRKIELFERRMVGGGLFSSIALRRAEPDDPGDERYHVRVELRERRPRSMQTGIGYRTDTGGEASLQYQDRNLFGGGENFIARIKGGEEGLDARLSVTVPFFRRPDQQWTTSIQYREEKPDAYDVQALEAETSLARELTPSITLRGGMAIRHLDEQQEGGRNYLLVSLPLRASWDITNDRLDATRGMRIIFLTEPFHSLSQHDVHFWKNMATVQGFIPLRRNNRMTLALRAAAGGIAGDSLDDIPADSRFYAGGGMSVRGYAYQALSPRDEDTIIGGLSVIETSIELRNRIGSSFGTVLFLDGGSAFPARMLDADKALRWGAGAGLRYFTPVGPIRADIGLPLNRRSGIDDSWQFYISIGQAF